MATRLGACPQFNGAGTAFSGTSTGAQSVNIPTSNSGDLLVLVALASASNNDGAVGSLTAGWTQVGGASNVYGGTQAARIAVGWLVSAGTDGTTSVSVTFGGTGATVRFAARVYKFKAADGFAATPLANVSTANTGTSTSISMATVTPSGNNQMAVQASGVALNTTIGNASGETGGNWFAPFGPGTGTSTAASQATAGTMGIQCSVQQGGGAISGGTSTITSANWVTIGFSLIPTASVTTTEGALPAYSSAGTLFSGTATGAQNINIPSSNADDLLLLVALARASNNDGAIGSLTAGWTQLGGASNVYGGTISARIGGGWLVSAGTSGSTNVSVTFGGTGTVRFLARVYRFTATNKFHPTTAVSNIGFANTSTSATQINPPPVFPSGVNQLAVLMYGHSVSTSVSAATNENGGDWTEPVAEDATTNGTIGIQTSDQTSGAGIQGGIISPLTSGDWTAIGVTLIPRFVYDLTATGTSSKPTLGQPAIGQKHALAVNALSFTIALPHPTVGQKHVLTATGPSSKPTLGQPVLNLKRNLTANNLGIVITLPQPVMGLKRNLAASNLAPVITLPHPTVGQKHVLTATGPSSKPTLGQPTLGQKHALATNALSFAITLPHPTVGQTHKLTATNLAPVITLPHPTVGQKHALAVTPLSLTITLPHPSVGQKHVLAATNLAPAITLPHPSVGQKHVLAATSIAIVAPSLPHPAIGQKHALTATGTSSKPTLGQPELAVLLAGLNAANLNATPSPLPHPSVGQKHVLAATSLTNVAPSLPQPTLGVKHNLVASSLVASAPVLGQPTVVLALNTLAASSLVAAASPLPHPSVGQKHVLTATSLTGQAPLLGQPSIVAGLSALSAASLVAAAPVLAHPTLAQVYNFSTVGIASRPVLGSSNIGFGYNFAAANLSTIVQLGTPSLNKGYRVTGRAGMVNIPPDGAAALVDRKVAVGAVEDLGPIAA